MNCASEWNTDTMIIHTVFARVRLGVDHDFLAAYSTSARAQAFIDAQDESLKPCLVTWEVEIDRHPSDDFWTAPPAFEPEDGPLTGHVKIARDELNERIDRLARLAAGTEYALVCGGCGHAISRLAAYVEQSPLSHTYSPGTCDVCGRTGSVNHSGDWIGEGD